MTLGGLREGVTPLDLAHAYLTFANGGKLVYGTLSPGEDAQGRRSGVPGPAGIDVDPPRQRTTQSIELPSGERARNRAHPSRCSTPRSPARRPRCSGRRQGRDGQARVARPDELAARQDGHDRELLRRLVRRLDARATRSRSGSATPTASSR